MHGARAVLKEIAKKYPGETISIHLVWLPMVCGDDERTARRIGASFPPHVHQYYDSERASGLAFTNDAFSGCLDRAIQATPRDHPLHNDLVDWAASRESGPLWDVVLCFGRGTTWTDRAPPPLFWSKQVAFFGNAAGVSSGTFFRNDCGQPPVDSDWFHEVRLAVQSLLDPSGSPSPD